VVDDGTGGRLEGSKLVTSCAEGSRLVPNVKGLKRGLNGSRNGSSGQHEIRAQPDHVVRVQVGLGHAKPHQSYSR
jgi:hypothetical protein